MPLFDTDCIVLRSYNLSEADRIVVFYTRDHGLIRGVAKGAKRLTSKFGSTLEPFSELRIEYFQKEDRDLVSIQKTDLIRSSFIMASDPERLSTFSYLADLLLEFTPPHDPNTVLHRMLRACFAVELELPGQHQALKLYFETWLMRLGGYLPDWTTCAICKKHFASEEVTSILSGFRLACSACSQGRTGESVSSLERMLLGSVQSVAPADFVRSADSETVRNVSSIISRIVSAHSGREVSIAASSIQRSQ